MFAQATDDFEGSVTVEVIDERTERVVYRRVYDYDFLADRHDARRLADRDVDRLIDSKVAIGGATNFLMPQSPLFKRVA